VSGKAVKPDRLKEVDNTLFEGKLIRIATASLVTAGWEGSDRK